MGLWVAKKYDVQYSVCDGFEGMTCESASLMSSLGIPFDGEEGNEDYWEFKFSKGQWGNAMEKFRTDPHDGDIVEALRVREKTREEAVSLLQECLGGDNPGLHNLHFCHNMC